MESIKAVLARSQQSTPTPTSSEPQQQADYDLWSDDSREAARERLRLNLNVTSLGDTLETFASRPGSESALAAVRALAAGTAPPLLLICGGVGCGKSRLLEGLAIALYRRVRVVNVLFTASRIHDSLTRAMKAQAIPPYEVVLRGWQSTPILLVDDLGAGTKMSDTWEWPVWESIVDYRWSHCSVTAITTNLDTSQLPARIQSRLLDRKRSVVVINRASDYRRERK